MQSAKAIFVSGLLALAACAGGTAAAQARQVDETPAATPQRGDGARDFDWEIGRWRTHVRLLAKRLSGSQEWFEYTGTSDVRALLGGRANLVELDVAGPAGRIHGLSLRLYQPEGRQWSLNYANARDGKLTAPVVGGFRDGRGEFYGQDQVDGRTVLVRFIITRPAPDTTQFEQARFEQARFEQARFEQARFEQARFEQAFSDDGGRTWETNWIATDTRIAPE